MNIPLGMLDATRVYVRPADGSVRPARAAALLAGVLAVGALALLLQLVPVPTARVRPGVPRSKESKYALYCPSWAQALVPAAATGRAARLGHGYYVSPCTP